MKQGESKIPCVLSEVGSLSSDLLRATISYLVE